MSSDPLAPLLELPGVVDGVAEARSSVDSLIAHRVLRRRSADVSAESSLRGAWISAVLAGSTSSQADVRSGAAAGDPIVQGALRVQAAIPTLTDTWTRAPRQALARLHALASADLVADAALLGRPASTPGVAERLDALASVLEVTSAPAVVVAAIVHGEILGLDAFTPASGVVARAAVRLTLIERGLDLKSLVVIEAGHRDLGAAYSTALAAYQGGTADGVAEWVRHCSEAVVVGARESLAICEAIQRG